ncbi:TPA: hypothetical protein DD425_02680 [Candidatus Saccharibacteria bacterium]|nr:hypothetical protein [Candidatus Saccharibacteria bacterium]
MIRTRVQRASHHSFVPTTTRHGFTIVELLIVIVVIAILASITIVAYTGVQANARDSIRKSDLASLQKALEINFLDEGAYTQPENRASDCSNDGGTDWASDSDLRDLITQSIIPSLPVDPVNDSTYRYCYEVNNANDMGYAQPGRAYDLCATLELGGNYCINKRT